MSDKAAKKKQFILETARGVFSKKGYKDVTMKDIVEACDISRGGLYLYFDSTETLLLECLQMEEEKTNVTEDMSAGDALALYLNEQKKMILGKEEDLSTAVYEYLFLKKANNETPSTVVPLFEKKVETIAHIIDKGVESGEFYCEDSEMAAKNICYTLEGLKITEKTVGISDKDMDTALLYILGGLFAEE